MPNNIRIVILSTKCGVSEQGLAMCSFTQCTGLPLGDATCQLIFFFTSKAWSLLPNFHLQMQILFKECSILSLWFTVFPLPLASCDTLWPVVSPLNCTIGNLQVVVVLFAAFVRLRKCRCSLHWLSIFLWKVYGDEKLFLIARFAIIFRGLKRDAEALICLWYASIEA